MKDLFKNMQGIKRFILISFVVMVLWLAVFNIIYIIGGRGEVAVDGTVVVVFVIAIFFAFSSVWVFVKKEKNKWWKYFTVLTTEVGLFSVSMLVAVPFISISVMALSVAVVVFLFAESKFRLWLADNPPKEIQFREKKENVGDGMYRIAEVITSRDSIRQPLRARLHRRLHRMYIL